MTRTRRFTRPAILSLCAAIGILGSIWESHSLIPHASSNRATTPRIISTRTTAGKSINAQADSSDWPLFGHDGWQTREAPDRSITPASIRELHLTWQFVVPGVHGSNESYPLEVGGRLYVTAPDGHVYALNATTGRRIWTFTPPPETTRPLAKVNRGVAVAGDSVYVLTPDDWLCRIRATDGHVMFRKRVADPANGTFESMAPAVAGNAIVIGSAGGDEGVRGFVAAYDALSGRKLWQFYTVPARGQGWMAATGDHGGGTVWTTPTFDRQHGTILFGTGNPSPDYFGASRPGPNPYTDSVVALRATTGQLVWAKQEVAHDLWDYDVASPPLLFQVGRRLAVGEAGKDGMWYEWDAATGKALTRPVAFVKQDHKPPTAAGVEEWPGPDGGANYGPSAFSDQTGEAYIAGINGPEVVYSGPQDHHGHELDFGTRQNPGPRKDWSGTITAVHVATGKVAWQIHLPAPAIGGVTLNRGGLVWFGRADGVLEAVSAQTGALVWQQSVGVPIGSAPVIYTRHGVTYVVVVTGGAGSLSSLFPWQGVSTVMAFALRR